MMRAWPLLLPHALLALALAGTGTGALAADGLQRAKQRGKLVAGIHYVVPEHQVSQKYRTPEALDQALLEDVAKRLKLPLATVSTKRASPGRTDLALAMPGEGGTPKRDAIAIPIGYAAGPMAIMRNDTDIKSWAQLQGRKVCVAEGSRHAGTLAARYGALEIVHRAPADALIALRIGECDATVHDNTLLEELIKLPEWKKFSARLPVEQRQALAFIVPAADKATAAFLRQVADDWTATAYPGQLAHKAARSIAFEVYLDQDVPDCH